MWTNTFVILIPFEHTEDIDRFARKYNVKKYTGIYLPSRGIKHPKKFIIVIEQWDTSDMPEGMWKSFYNQDWSLGYGSNNINELKKIEKEVKSSESWDNPYIYWNLTNGNYIYFSANIKKPLLIYIF